MNRRTNSHEEWRRQSFAAELLSLCLRTTELPDGYVWQADVPSFHSEDNDDANDKQKVDAVVYEFVLQSMAHASTQTERRRWIEQQLHSTGVRRLSLVQNVASKHVFLDGLTPSVKLESFRAWRTICHFNDEELLVAVAVGDHIERRFGPELVDKPSDLISVAKQIVRAWPVHLRPNGNDVEELLVGFDNDAHVHYGQLMPSPALWRLLMQGNYEPCKEIAGTGEIETVGPKWIAENYLEWRERRDALDDLWNDLSGKLWQDECSPTPFPGITSAAPPMWNDIDIDLEGFLERFLAEERILLICAGFIARFNPDAAEAFWQYAAARSMFSWFQVPSEAGFESFVRTRDIDKVQGYEWGKAGGVDIWFQLVLAWLSSSGLRRLAVRQNMPSNDKSKKHITKLVSEYFDRFGTALVRLREDYKVSEIMFDVVLSFNRRQGGRWASSYCRRHKDWRNTRSDVLKWQENWAMSDFAGSDGANGIGRAVIAVDAISNEYGFDVGIIGPPFNRFRLFSQDQFDVRGSRNAAGFELSDPTPLARFYHSGEDLEHPVSALRNILEAVHFLKMDANDRIGHGSVLLREPENYEADESLGERLDNLVAIWFVLSRLKQTHKCPSLREELLQTHNLLHEANGLKLTVPELMESWLLRQEHEEKVIRSFLSRPHILAAYFGYASFPEKQRLGDGQENDPVEEFLTEEEVGEWRQFRSNFEGCSASVYEDRSKPISELYEADWWTALLTSVIGEIQQCGVVIETCPSSNLTISGGWTEELPAFGLFNLGLEHNLLVGTDDPKMFKTDLATEVSLILESLSREMGRRKAVATMKATMLQTQMSGSS